MRILAKHEIEQVYDVRTEEVPVPEWGEDAGVIVRSMTCAEHKAFAKRVEKEQDDATIAAELCVSTVIDPYGSLVFDLGDAKMLATKSVAAVKRIAKVAARLSGLNKDAVEEAQKNS